MATNDDYRRAAAARIAQLRQEILERNRLSQESEGYVEDEMQLDIMQTVAEAPSVEYVYETDCVLHIVHAKGEEFVEFEVRHGGIPENQITPEDIKSYFQHSILQIFQHASRPYEFVPINGDPVFYLLPSQIIKLTPYLMEEYQQKFNGRTQFEQTSPPTLTI